MNRERAAGGTLSGGPEASIAPASTDPTATQPIDIRALIIEQE